MNEPWHGTDNGYNWHHCRCGDCCAAHGAMQARMRDQATARGRADPALIPHGTSNGYTYWGCRCQRCQDANTARNNEWSRRRRAAAQSP